MVLAALHLQVRWLLRGCLARERRPVGGFGVTGRRQPGRTPKVGQLYLEIILQWSIKKGLNYTPVEHNPVKGVPGR